MALPVLGIRKSAPKVQVPRSAPEPAASGGHEKWQLSCLRRSWQRQLYQENHLPLRIEVRPKKGNAPNESYSGDGNRTRKILFDWNGFGFLGYTPWNSKWCWWTKLADFQNMGEACPTMTGFQNISNTLSETHKSPLKMWCLSGCKNMELLIEGVEW